MEDNYDDLTDEQFDIILERMVKSMSGRELLEIPGIYEVLREELNNEVLTEWEAGRDG